MTIRGDVLATLDDDATLMAILTGGMYDAGLLPADGLTPTSAPAAFNGARVKPCGLIRWRNVGETAIVGSSRRRFFQIFFYQVAGQTQIEAAQSRCRVLLHHKKQFKTSGGQVYYTRWVGDVNDLIAEELDGAAMGYSDFYADFLEE
jgi:hypothetical protein